MFWGPLPGPGPPVGPAPAPPKPPGNGLEPPAGAATALHHVLELEHSLAKMIGKPNEVAVDIIDGIINLKRRFTGEVARTILGEEAALVVFHRGIHRGGVALVYPLGKALEEAQPVPFDNNFVLLVENARQEPYMSSLTGGRGLVALNFKFQADIVSRANGADELGVVLNDGEQRFSKDARLPTESRCDGHG